MSQDVIHYQPTCDLKAMRARAQMYSQIRQFFSEREVLEVETPILSQVGCDRCAFDFGSSAAPCTR